MMYNLATSISTNSRTSNSPPISFTISPCATHTSTICQLLAKHKKNRCQIKQCHQANLINKTTLCVVVMGDVTGLFASRELGGEKTYRKLIYLCVAYMQIDTKARPIVSFLKAKLASQPSGFHISKGLYVNITISQHNVDITANLHNYRQ